MALQGAGAISLSQVQTEFGGGNPISMSEYYRNGAYVPTAIPGSTTAWIYSQAAPQYYWSDAYWGFVRQVWWEGTLLTSNVGYNVYSYSSGAFTYYRGGYVTNYTTNYSGGVGQFVNTYFYYIYRQGSTTFTNFQIPTNGIIRMSNFYNGRKT